jgi:hypothetical protein
MPHALAPGFEIAGYRIESVLGEGATGAVYLARDREGRAVALKVLARRVAARWRARRVPPSLCQAARGGSLQPPVSPL